MSQYDFGTMDPVEESGTELAAELNSWRTALHSLHRGSARPAYAIAGILWIKDSVSPWLLNVYDGTSDVVIGTINTGSHLFTPSFGSVSGVLRADGVGGVTAATAAQLVAAIGATAVAKATNASTAAACSGNSATASTAGACSGNAATASQASALAQNPGTYTHIGGWGLGPVAATTFLVNRAYMSDTCTGAAASAGYASSAGNADTLDGYPAASFSLTSHTHSYAPKTAFVAAAPSSGNLVLTRADGGTVVINLNP